MKNILHTSAASLIATFALGMVVAVPHARATVVLGSGTTIADDYDSDGFGFPVDNAPSVANPAQIDIDDDGVGDVVDPVPTDVAFPQVVTASISAPTEITVSLGEEVAFFLTAVAPTAVPTLIQLNLDDQVSGVEAHSNVFTQLTSAEEIIIPANLYSSSGVWDLNSPGTYELGVSLAQVPGLNGSNMATVMVTVVPEPSTIVQVIVGLCAFAFLIARNRHLYAAGRR